MKNLENKIKKKVYKIETEKTGFYIFSRSLFFIIGIFLIFILVSLSYDILKEQGSFDLLDFFKEDMEVVKRYWFENINVFIEETPKTILAILLLVILVFVYLVYKIFNNLNRLKN